MTPLTLALVLVAAVTHASWNLLAKQAASAGAAFVAAYTAVATLLYAPVALWALLRFGLAVTPATLGCIVASGVLHLVYSLVLQRGYRAADMSVVYPVARGTGPLISACAAFLLLGEAASATRIAGLLVVVAGILTLAGMGGWRTIVSGGDRRGLAWGGATGTAIASYTVVDGWGAKVLGIHPVLLDWCANTVRLGFLLPGVLREPAAFSARMAGHWRLAVGVGVLAPLGYILVLTALRLGAPLSVVAPAREMSMMVGALLATLVLGERMSAARLGGCLLIVAGVVLLSR